MPETEKRNPKAYEIDSVSTGRILRLINEEDASVPNAVKAAIPSITKAVDKAVEVIKNGGRIFYVGAGTSGRLGVLDASEMPPTFSVSSHLFQAIIAGGDEALRNSIEGAEDDLDAGREAASRIEFGDMVIGISANGATPFVLSCLAAAKDRGAACWLLTCNDIEMPLTLSPQPSPTEPTEGAYAGAQATLSPFVIDGIIKILTGPEIIAGSTRMKAGTATKLVLNMFSAAVNIKMGKVYQGLMVDVRPSNRKLIKRAENIIMAVAGCGSEEAAEYLNLSGMRPKVAIVMKARGLSKEEAEGLLAETGGFLRNIL